LHPILSTQICSRLTSALGVYDGNVYEALWERAKTEPLNRREVPEGYEVDFDSHSSGSRFSDLYLVLPGIHQTHAPTWTEIGLSQTVA
jgi:hypothetical protein